MRRVDGFSISGRLKGVDGDLHETTSGFDTITVPDEAEYVDFSRLTVEAWSNDQYVCYVDGDQRSSERGHNLNECIRKQLVARPELAITRERRDEIGDNAFAVTWVHHNKPDPRACYVAIPLAPEELKVMRAPAFRAADFRNIRPIGMWSSAHPSPIATPPGCPDAELRSPEHARFYHLLDVPLTPYGRERKARLFAAVRRHLPVEPLLTNLAALELDLKEIKMEVVVVIGGSLAGVYTASFKILDMLACRPGLAMNAEFVAQAMDYDGAWAVLRREMLTIMEEKR